ncbi:hypothetical protein HDV06_001685 [Boothiomyces sp. JEL0866]|nr:hypothetical protein HDV06_001685 [Boothiomyces sp. JEL0866]
MNKKLVEFNNQFFNKAQEFKEYKLLIKQLQLLAKKKQLLQHYYNDLDKGSSSDQLTFLGLVDSTANDPEAVVDSFIEKQDSVNLESLPENPDITNPHPEQLENPEISNPEPEQLENPETYYADILERGKETLNERKETEIKLIELDKIEHEISAKLNKFNLKELEFISKNLSLIKSPKIEIVSEANINSSIFTFSYFIQNITHISIKTGSVSTRDFELLIDFIETRKLQYLQLINQVDLFNYSSISLKDILKRINFFKCRISELSLVELMQDNYHLRLPKFEKLELVNMGLNDADLQEIDFSNCHTLILKNNYFTEKGLQKIITSRLKNMNISNQFCSIDFIVFDYLEKIEFDSISFTEKEVYFLAVGLSKSRIESFSLKDCGITITGLKKILIKTKYLQNLELLNLIYTKQEVEKRGNKYQPTFDEIKESFQIERYAVLLVSEYIKTTKLVSLKFHIKGEYYTFMTLMYDSIKLNKSITSLNDQWSFCKGFIKQNQANQAQQIVQLSTSIRCLKMLDLHGDLLNIIVEEFLIGIIPLKYKKKVFKLFVRFGLRYRNVDEFVDQLININ